MGQSANWLQLTVYQEVFFCHHILLILLLLFSTIYLLNLTHLPLYSIIHVFGTLSHSIIILLGPLVKIEHESVDGRITKNTATYEATTALETALGHVSCQKHGCG